MKIKYLKILIVKCVNKWFPRWRKCAWGRKGLISCSFRNIRRADRCVVDATRLVPPETPPLCKWFLSEMPPLNAAAKSLELPHVACRRRSRERFEPPLPGVCWVERWPTNKSISEIYSVFILRAAKCHGKCSGVFYGRKTTSKKDAPRRALIFLLSRSALSLCWRSLCARKNGAKYLLPISSHII